MTRNLPTEERNIFRKKVFYLATGVAMITMLFSFEISQIPLFSLEPLVHLNSNRFSKSKICQKFFTFRLFRMLDRIVSMNFDNFEELQKLIRLVKYFEPHVIFGD